MRSLRMLSRYVASAVVIFMIGGFILAGEYTGQVIKADKNSFTLKISGKKGKEGEEKKFNLFKDDTIMKGKDRVDRKDFVEMVTEATKSKKKGVFAKVTTDADDKYISKIEIVEPKGKGKTDK
jgi:hypothetical protein